MSGHAICKSATGKSVNCKPNNYKLQHDQPVSCYMRVTICELQVVSVCTLFPVRKLDRVKVIRKSNNIFQDIQ